MIDSDNWYYHEDGVALGPFSQQVIETCFSDGVLTPESLLWHPSREQWAPLVDFEPLWSQTASSPILQPGPLRIPMSAQSLADKGPIPLELPAARPAPKPLARSKSSPPMPKPSFLKRLFARKS